MKHAGTQSHRALSLLSSIIRISISISPALHSQPHRHCKYTDSYFEFSGFSLSNMRMCSFFVVINVYTKYIFRFWTVVQRERHPLDVCYAEKATEVNQLAPGHPASK